MQIAKKEKIKQTQKVTKEIEKERKKTLRSPSLEPLSKYTCIRLS